jgi:vacuolar-type H+-ATPase subunit C/Vma6
MFGGKQYYGLVAGLREWTMDGSSDRGFNAEAIVAEIRAGLSRRDRRTMQLFYGFNDLANIVNLRAGRSHFDTLGNLSREDIEAALAPAQLAGVTAVGAADDEDPLAPLPEWMARVVAAYLRPDDDSEGADTSLPLEKALFEAYYAECAASDCEFLRSWSRFDRNLRNIIAAYTARNKNMPVVDALVGSDEIVLSLTKSPAADFGLKGELEYIDALLAAMGDAANIVEKERAIDIIRWEKADELAEFDSFGIPTLLAYLVKVGIIHRWAALDPAVGREMYERLVGEMSDSIQMKNEK